MHVPRCLAVKCLGTEAVAVGTDLARSRGQRGSTILRCGVGFRLYQHSAAARHAHGVNCVNVFCAAGCLARFVFSEWHASMKQ